MRNTDKAWQRFGKIAPYFAVLAHPRFSAAAKDGETRREFFTSGAEHVERLFAIIRETIDPEFAPRRALDFGCGVGRVTIPLARRVAQVVGVDVSDSMLDEANKNCEEAGVRNVTLIKSDDSLENLSGDFDFLHSFIVFQHIPARRQDPPRNASAPVMQRSRRPPLHLRDSRPRLETLVARTPRDLPLGQRPSQPCKRRFFQTSIHRDAQLQRQPAAPPSARARVSSYSPPVHRSWPIQRHSFAL